jgi:DNA-directed RNA polymerase subunit N (RpoN/RPB10)
MSHEENKNKIEYDIKYDKIDPSFIPIRCFTCGKVTPNIYKIIDLIKSGKTNFEIFNDINLKYCCRRMLSCVFEE